MTETSTPIDILDGLNTEDGEVAKWILPLIFPDLNARTLQEKGNEHLLQDNVARLAGNLQAVASNVAAYSEALQTQWRAIAVLARGQGQTTNDMRELRALIESVVAGVTDVAREQTAVRGAMQDNTKVMSTTAEAIQQGQRILQTEVEKITEATEQTNAALTATAAEQTAVHETVRRVREEVTGLAGKQDALGEAVQAHAQAGAAATATLAGRHDQLAGDVRRLHELTQTVVGGVADVVREQAATRGAMQETARVMGATTEAIQQGQKNLQTEVEEMVETTQQAVTALTATAAEQTAVRETVRRMSEEVTGIAGRQTALGEAVQAHEQASAAATATLAGRHDQLAGDIRQLHELTQAVAGGVADVVREQVAVRGAVQESAGVTSAATEAIQQGQRALQSEMERIADTTKQTSAAVTATAAEQTAVHETVRRMSEEVTGIAGRQTALSEAVQAHEQASAAATATLVGRHDQLAGDVRQLHELTQTVAGGVADAVREQVAVRGAVQESAGVTSAATEAIQQGQRALQSEMERIADTTKQTSAAVTATAAEQTVVHETVKRMREEVTDVAARQTALSEAVQAHEQASAAATAILAGGQEQLASDVRRLHELTQAVAGGVADVVREQAAVHGAVQDSTKAMSATTEAIQQGQKALQTEVEKITEATKQTSAAVTATAAEQTAAHQTVRRVMEEVTAVGAGQTALHEAVQAHGQAITGAIAPLAGGQEQLAGEVRRLHELTQTVVGGVADVAREQAAVRGAMQDSTKAMSATTEAIQQGQRTLQTEMEKMVETAGQTTAALTATAAEQTAVHETVRRVREEVTGVGTGQTALHEAVQAHGQALTGAAATLAGGQEQLAGEVRRLHELTQMAVGSVADVAREQAAVRGAVQDSTKVMSTTIETIQQGLRTLQTEVEKMVETTRQTIAALTVTAVEQTTGQEITRRMIGELANTAMAALAAGQGRLSGDVPPLPASTRTVDDLGSLEVRPPVPAEEGASPQTLHAAKAITHGEQIRYEVGPDRDNLGFWMNPGDWAEWELDITRPGQFRVTAQIAAVAPGRFQVVVGDQKLEGSAPNTGDYARFQEVELGIVTLTSSGKTSVAVRPVPEGWEPMNLKSLDLVPLARAVPCGA